MWHPKKLVALIKIPTPAAEASTTRPTLLTLPLISSHPYLSNTTTNNLHLKPQLPNIHFTVLFVLLQQILGSSRSLLWCTLCHRETFVSQMDQIRAKLSNVFDVLEVTSWLLLALFSVSFFINRSEIKINISDFSGAFIISRLLYKNKIKFQSVQTRIRHFVLLGQFQWILLLLMIPYVFSYIFRF